MLILISPSNTFTFRPPLSDKVLSLYSTAGDIQLGVDNLSEITAGSITLRGANNVKLLAKTRSSQWVNISSGDDIIIANTLTATNSMHFDAGVEQSTNQAGWADILMQEGGSVTEAISGGMSSFVGGLQGMGAALQSLLSGPFLLIVAIAGLLYLADKYSSGGVVAGDIPGVFIKFVTMFF